MCDNSLLFCYINTLTSHFFVSLITDYSTIPANSSLLTNKLYTLKIQTKHDSPTII